MSGKTQIDKLTRLGIVGSIFLVACAVFYYLVIYIPGKERAKAEEARIAAEQLREKEDNKKIQLDTCLIEADDQYSKNWNKECKSQGKLSAECIKLLDMTLSDYEKEKGVSEDKSFSLFGEFYKKKSDCSCRLSFDNSDRIEGWRKEAKEECYRQYGN